MTEDRNPSPPREFEDLPEKFRGDVIGDTAISKTWIYTVLLKVCTEGDRHREHEESITLDLPEDLQDDMCRFWDLCLEEDVVKFLVNSDAMELLCRVVSVSKSPRMTEIIIGILGNMSCSPTGCAALSNNPEALLAIVSLFSCRDSLTLVQLGRLVATCLSNNPVQDAWLDFIESNITSFLADVTFILEFCSNRLVLKYVLEIVDICLDSRDDILLLLSKKEFSSCVAEAGMQLLESDDTLASMGTPLHILYLITTLDLDLDTFACNNSILEYSLKCCQIWSELDDFSIADDNPSVFTLASLLTICFNVLQTSLSSDDCGKKFLDDVSQFQRRNILLVVDSTIKYCSKLCNNNPSKSLRSEPSEETHSPEKTECEVSVQIQDDRYSQGVPLLDIVHDLKNVIMKLGWTRTE